ncbi:unnamed protein product [Allacma fusca]|uniref:maleylacetoacetate isomerase n=1 Tax=Allacma fusca TaxID=39272 RepID=A0A8J2M650_9HEXA|nr:unnamed protein product [Allacma fusca]
MSENPILYSYFRSSCAWRVRTALALKGIEYEYRSVHLLKKEQQDEEYIRVNPMGQVPALIIEGKTLCQSIAILEFLEETYPEVPLLPTDRFERAIVRELVELVNSGIQPLTNLGPTLRHSDDPQERAKWLQHWFGKGFLALETRLAETAGTYCFGDTLTLADLCLVPQVANGIRWNIDLSPYPIIARINQTLLSLEAFKKSHPSAQPDCPPEFK